MRNTVTELIREIEIEDAFMQAIQELSADIAESDLSEILEILLERGA